MSYGRFSLVLLVLTTWTASAPAGLFSKKSKPNPAEHVPALIATLRGDPEERKRVSAAEELRQYDPAMFPELIPTLAEAAQHDPKSGVRLEAIQSLAKLRPISQRAGQALEQATHDDSMRVRLQARTLLWQYHMAGYKGGKTPDIGGPPDSMHTEEPPLATPLEPPTVSSFQKSVTPSVTIIPSPPATSPATITTPQPTVGYVAPANQANSRTNIWTGARNSQPLPRQPAAVPLGPRPLPSGTSPAQATGPRPLPTGPATVMDKGPKPLPEGPPDSVVKPATTIEPPAAPSQDDGPDLTPP
jgi:HEAT repeats